MDRRNEVRECARRARRHAAAALVAHAVPGRASAAEAPPVYRVCDNLEDTPFRTNPFDQPGPAPQGFYDLTGVAAGVASSTRSESKRTFVGNGEDSGTDHAWDRHALATAAIFTDLGRFPAADLGIVA